MSEVPIKLGHVPINPDEQQGWLIIPVIDADGNDYPDQYQNIPIDLLSSSTSIHRYDSRYDYSKDFSDEGFVVGGERPILFVGTTSINGQPHLVEGTHFRSGMRTGKVKIGAKDEVIEYINDLEHQRQIDEMHLKLFELGNLSMEVLGGNSYQSEVEFNGQKLTCRLTPLGKGMADRSKSLFKLAVQEQGGQVFEYQLIVLLGFGRPNIESYHRIASDRKRQDLTDEEHDRINGMLLAVTNDPDFTATLDELRQSKLEREEWKRQPLRKRAAAAISELLADLRSKP